MKNGEDILDFEPTLKAIVNYIANNEFDLIDGLVIYTHGWDADLLRGFFEDYLEANEISHIDSYETKCESTFAFDNKQLEVFVLDDQKSISIDYCLTTDGVLNGMVLQLVFKEEVFPKAYFCGIDMNQ